MKAKIRKRKHATRQLKARVYEMLVVARGKIKRFSDAACWLAIGSPSPMDHRHFDEIRNAAKDLKEIDALLADITENAGYSLKKASKGDW